MPGQDPNTLYFTAGIPGPGDLEDHGLFGSLSTATPEPASAALFGIAGLGAFLFFCHRFPSQGENIVDHSYGCRRLCSPIPKWLRSCNRPFALCAPMCRWTISRTYFRRADSNKNIGRSRSAAHSGLAAICSFVGPHSST